MSAHCWISMITRTAAEVLFGFSVVLFTFSVVLFTFSIVLHQNLSDRYVANFNGLDVPACALG
jgi:hypothetical protein